jgi:hypothetical protein
VVALEYELVVVDLPAILNVSPTVSLVCNVCVKEEKKVLGDKGKRNKSFLVHPLCAA